MLTEGHYALAFYIPLMLGVLILIHKRRHLQLKSTPNDRFFKKLVTAVLFTLRVFARNPLRGNRRRNTFRILFWCLEWGSNPSFSSNKSAHYLLEHGTTPFGLKSLKNHQKAQSLLLRLEFFYFFLSKVFKIGAHFYKNRIKTEFTF